LKKKEFIDIVAPIAIQLRLEGSLIFPSVRIAQAMLETGTVIHEWNNLVGFKVGNGATNAYWHGRSVSTKTWEVYDGVRYDNVTANWRAYDTIEDGFRDQDILFSRSRYTAVRAAQNPIQQTQALYESGYATDPSYATKLQGIIANNNLLTYDEEVTRMLEQLQKTIEELTTRVQALEATNKMDEVPDWAKASLDKAVKAGLVNQAKDGSLDFYRFLTVMDRKGLL
jgi:flagellar protein FlgJ